MGPEKNRLKVDPDQTATEHRTYGIADAYDTICFHTKCDYFEEYCSEKDNFLKYFQDRLHNDICLFVCFVALRPKSTAMVIAGQSVHLTTLFPGQA